MALNASKKSGIQPELSSKNPFDSRPQYEYIQSSAVQEQWRGGKRGRWKGKDEGGKEKSQAQVEELVDGVALDISIHAKEERAANIQEQGELAFLHRSREEEDIVQLIHCQALDYEQTLAGEKSSIYMGVSSKHNRTRQYIVSATTLGCRNVSAATAIITVPSITSLLPLIPCLLLLSWSSDVFIVPLLSLPPSSSSSSPPAKSVTNKEYDAPFLV